MMIIGCDFHPSWQQIAWLDSETGETGEHKLVHEKGEAQKYHGPLAAPVLIARRLAPTGQLCPDNAFTLIEGQPLCCSCWLAKRGPAPLSFG